jgi:hypothetical protein
MELEDETVARFENRDLARWFADPSSKDYWFHVRIVGPIIELHAEHLASDQRYVARGRRMDEAAPELLRLIRAYPPASAAATAAGEQDDAHASVVARAWRQASKVVSRVYSAVAG